MLSVEKIKSRNFWLKNLTDHDVLDSKLFDQQEVLLRLRHAAVGGPDNQDGGVHLTGSCDHILEMEKDVMIKSMVYDTNGVGNGDKSEFDIEFDDRCWVQIFQSIDINWIPVCTLSNKTNLISSNSYDVVWK